MSEQHQDVFQLIDLGVNSEKPISREKAAEYICRLFFRRKFSVDQIAEATGRTKREIEDAIRQSNQNS